MKKNYLFLLLFFAAILNSLAQTGPAGIGTFDGSIGPRNVLWLRADAGVATSGGFVDSWADQTTNGLNASQGSAGLRPSFDAANAAFNGFPSMNFLPGAAANYHLAVPDNDLLDDSPGMSFFIVLNPSTNGTQGILNKRTDAGQNQAYRLYRNGGTILSNISNGANASVTVPNAPTIFSSVYDQTLAGNKYNLFVNSITNGSSNVTTTLPNRASPLYIGNFDLTDNRSFDGDIAEIIIYNDAVNGAERIIVENYLSEKYNLSIGANDFFTSGDVGYDNDLVGIGTTDGSVKRSTSGFSDALQISELGNTLNAANEFILMAHDNTAHGQGAAVTDPDVTNRWARSWYLESSGAVSAELRFDFGDAGLTLSNPASDYVLLYRATTADNFTRVLSNAISIENADQVVVNLSNLSLPSGYYTLGRGTQIVNNTFYSFQSGNWEDPETWTTDPSGALLEPLSGNLPTAGDNMVVLSGTTVTMATDDNDGVSLTVNGRLNIENTVDHNYFSIAGNGIISIEGASGSDNFPSGATTNFADSIVGGTVLIEAGNFDLDTDRNYNNLIIDLASPTNTVTLLSDYRLNGDLTIQQGILRINDDTETTNLNIDVFGNAQVDASAEINVGTGNARHQFNFYGDFTNNGRAEFTNRSMAIFNAEATDGIVDANFLDDDADQTIDCNGVTNFYRIEIDKGVDETYILDINALSAGNFNLFGFASEAHPSTAQLTDNANALALIRGTVRLNANVDIEELNDGGNYNLSEAARLWVNGGSVTTGGNSIVPYGTIRVSDGFVVAPGTAGITTRDNGTIIVEGGTVTTNQIRTSVLGADNIGGYFQSGGTVNVTGGSIGTSYYTFSLTYSGNTFNMSGGTLNVSGSQPLNGSGAGGGIFINSDPGNISVTGGTVIMENTTNTNFKVTSRAPFWNVIMRSTGGTATEVELDEGSSGPGGAPETILTPELLVLNDLTIEAGVLLDHNGFDVEIGSDFSIDDNAVLDPLGNNKGYLYDPAQPNTTTFNGVDDSFIYVGQSTETGYELELTNMVVNKPADRTVTLTGDPAKEAANVATSFFARLLQITGDFRLESGTLNQGEHAIRLFGTAFISSTGQLAVYEDGVTETNATVVFRGSGLTVETEEGAQIGNFNMDTAIPTQEISFTSDVKIIRMGYIDGKINLGENNMTIDFLHDGTTTNRLALNDAGIANSGGEAFYTAGNSSDGGLSLLVAGNTAGSPYDFPIGVSGKFTPVSLEVTDFVDDGYITFNPVNQALATLNNAPTDVLQYNWNLSHADFGTVPNIQMTLTYVDGDVNGDETLYVPGRVIDGTNREEDLTGSVDDAANTIDFGVLTLKEGNYTAGLASAFTGSVRVLWSRKQGEWHDPTTWSLTEEGTALTLPSELPGPNDIVVVGTTSNNYHVAICDGIGDDCSGTNYAPITVAQVSIMRQGGGESSILSIDETAGVHDLGIVTHLNPEDPTNVNNSSKFAVAGPTLPAGDFGEFADAPNTIFVYTRKFPGNVTNPRRINKNGGGLVSDITVPSYTMGNTITEYSNIQFEYTNRSGGEVTLPDVDITVNKVIKFWAGNKIVFNTGVGGDVKIKGDLSYTTNTVEFIFPATGNVRTLDIEGDLDINNQTNIDILVEDGGDGSLTHLLKVQGSILDARTGSNPTELTLFRSQVKTAVNLEFYGDGNSTMDAFATVTVPELNQLIVNKNSTIGEVEILSDFNLGAATNGATKAIDLDRGMLKLNNVDITVDLTTGGDSFNIPSGTGLQVTQGTLNVSGNDSGIILDGSLIIDGANGTLDMDDAVGNGNNFIEYSASGNALLEISAGTLNVGSQIRGITSAETGVLRYRQTGGDVRIGTQAGPENTRGMLQIYNVGSEFTYTGGTLTIERHQDSPSVAALFLNPDDSDVTQPIQIFNANTPVGENDFRINSVIAIQDLIIGGTNNPVAELDINPLTIEGNLTIESGGSLNGNGRTLTVGGDFDNAGTYDGQNNETIFNSSGIQQITGAGTFNFFRFTKSETGTLDLTSTLNVEDLFTISDGILSDNGNTINLAADAVIDGIHSSTGGNGIVFAGGAAQELRRSAAGTGTLGTLTINNANGVNIPDGNGYDFNIDGGLRLENGVFNVGGSEILLGISAEITAVNSFGVSNMIRTNSSFTDGGVGKVFNSGVRPDFVFPVGQTFYTPVTFDFGTVGTTSGTINILPANEVHPTINDGVPDPVLPLATGDVNNALQYYWTVRTSGLTGFTADMNLEYDQSDVLVLEPGLDEDDYIAARILSQNNPTFLINKFTSTEVFEPNTITFNFPGVDSESISGDYFAGIDQAIPNNVLTYVVQGIGGDANDEVYDLDVPGVGNYPSGSVVIIPSGATLTLPLGADGIRLYAMEIQDGGVLEVDNSTNHRLGELSGTGTMRLVSDGINANTPAFAGNFFSCAGGGLEYGGSGNYGVMSGITEVRNLSFIGSGTKTFANNNVEVCEDLVVDGPALTFANGRVLNIDNDLIVNSGIVNSGSAQTTVANNFEISGGIFDAENGGFLRVEQDMSIGGGTYVAGSAGNLFLEGDLTFNAGTYVSGSGPHRVRFVGSSVQSISGMFTGSASFHRLQVSNANGIVLAGGSVEVSNLLFLNNGIITTQGFPFRLTASGSVSPILGNSSSYINGELQKVLASSGNSFNFPIGSANRWRPATINNVSDGGLTWSAQFFAADAVANENSAPNDVLNFTPTDPTILTLAENEYWKISDDAGVAPPPGVTATVGLSWGTESDVSAVFAEREELEVMIWNEGLGSWDNLNGGSFSAGHTQSEGRFTAGISNGFSEKVFTLGSPTLANPLPITLNSFEGTLDQNVVVLDWSTSSEVNNDYFEVQKSGDGITFETITIVDGSGNSTEEVAYSYVDGNPFIGQNYYRLKQVDFDGQFAIEEKVVLVDYTPVDVPLSLTVFPNPTNESQINLRIESDVRGVVQIVMYDLFGKRVANRIINSGEFTGGEIKLAPDQSLTQGMYIITIEQYGKTITKRVIINE